MYKRTRVRITLPKQYLQALNQLVEKGIYINREETIMDALRQFFQYYRIEPFTDKTVKLKTINNSVS